jgi:hypothetical protein
MSVAPATTTSILVSITGVLQDPSTYSVSGTTLTFSAAPPSGTGNISVRYLGIPASGVTTTAYRTVTEFTATAGQTSFTTPSYTVGYINVYRNGVLLGSADYTATTGTTIVLTAGASAGDLVTTESFYVSSVLNAIPATAGAVNSSYLSPNLTLGGTTILGSGGAVVPSWTTAGRPASPTIGQYGYNTTTAGLELYGTNGWTQITNGPSMAAYATVVTSIPNTVGVIFTMNAKVYDTNTCFNNTGSTVTLNGLSVPAYAFCPNVPGYYQINLSFYIPMSTTTTCQGYIYKNGGLYALGYGGFSDGTNNLSGASTAVYLNGSGDYIQVGCWQNSGVTKNNALNGTVGTFFNASFMRGA